MDAVMARGTTAVTITATATTTATTFVMARAAPTDLMKIDAAMTVAAEEGLRLTIAETTAEKVAGATEALSSSEGASAKSAAESIGEDSIKKLGE